MKIIMGLLFLTISLNSTAANLTTSKETKNLCKNSVTLLSKGKISESFNLLKPHWPLPLAELDNLSYQTKTQLGMVSKRFGNSIGTDFIKTQKAGSSFLKHTYILKYEKHPFGTYASFTNLNTHGLLTRLHGMTRHHFYSNNG